MSHAKSNAAATGKKTAALPPTRTGEPCPGPSEVKGERCGRPVVAHGLCRSHGRMQAAGEELRPVGRRKERAPGSVFAWSIHWSSDEHVEAVKAMARDERRGERDFIRHVIEDLAESRGLVKKPKSSKAKPSPAR